MQMVALDQWQRNMEMQSVHCLPIPLPAVDLTSMAGTPQQMALEPHMQILLVTHLVILEYFTHNGLRQMSLQLSNRITLVAHLTQLNLFQLALRQH
jgi:hypothetical protein